MKKYIVYKVAVLLLCTALLTGCGQKDKAALPEDFCIQQRRRRVGDLYDAGTGRGIFGGVLRR